MKIIKPTKEQIFRELRKTCCWLGGSGCECKSRQLSVCYADTEKFLTKTEYTEEEIKQKQKQNQKAMKDIEKALNDAWGE